MLGEIDRRTALIGAGALGLAISSRGAAPLQSLRAAGSEPLPGLRARADRKGLLIGSSVYAKTLREDGRIAAMLREDANILVPEVELKWSSLEPAQGTFTFDAAEAIHAFAAHNGMKMRGHTLTWYRAMPDWAQQTIPDLSPAAAGTMLERYVSTVVGHWKGRLVQWDVANEAIDGRRLLTEPLWSKKLGERYLDIAFHAAHRADPGAMLVFNTDLIELDDPYHEEHRGATLELLGRLVKRGVPVHALGIEAHLQGDARFDAAIFHRFLNQVTAMGLKVILTEFDISDHRVPGDIATRDSAVAALGKAFLDASFADRQCLGMLTWSPVDRYSWLRWEANQQRPDTSPLRPGLRDDAFKRKPLWSAVAAAIDGAPKR